MSKFPILSWHVAVPILFLEGLEPLDIDVPLLDSNLGKFCTMSVDAVFFVGYSFKILFRIISSTPILVIDYHVPWKNFSGIALVDESAEGATFIFVPKIKIFVV